MIRNYDDADIWHLLGYLVCEAGKDVGKFDGITVSDGLYDALDEAERIETSIGLGGLCFLSCEGKPVLRLRSKRKVNIDSGECKGVIEFLRKGEVIGNIIEDLALGRTVVS